MDTIELILNAFLDKEEEKTSQNHKINSNLFDAEDKLYCKLSKEDKKLFDTIMLETFNDYYNNQIELIKFVINFIKDLK